MAILRSAASICLAKMPADVLRGLSASIVKTPGGPFGVLLIKASTAEDPWKVIIFPPFVCTPMVNTVVLKQASRIQAPFAVARLAFRVEQF